MTKYIQNLDDLIIYLENLKFSELLDWISNYLSYGFTAPLAYTPINQSSAFFITQIFDNSEKSSFKLKIKKIIKEIYRSYSQNKYGDSLFIEILEIIGRLNITDLFPELWRDAWSEQFKDKTLDGYPDVIDLHTYILKSLFGISIEKKKNIKDVIKIIKRDISNPKYMLECFDVLYLIPKNVSTAINYIPYILDYIPTKKRDFEGSLNHYLQMLGIDNLQTYFPKILNLIGHNKNYVDIFIKTLENIGYSITNGGDYLNLFSKREMRLSDKIYFNTLDVRNIDIIYSVIDQQKMLRICDLSTNEIIPKILPNFNLLENMDRGL